MKWVLLLVAVIALSGCTATEPPQTPEPSVPNPPAGGLTELSVAITHSGGYSPNEWTVRKGETVRFLATSDLVSHDHGITIDAFNVNEAVLAGSGGEPQKVEFVADTAGTFDVYCKTCLQGPFGAHPWMTGTLTVTE